MKGTSKPSERRRKDKVDRARAANDRVKVYTFSVLFIESDEWWSAQCLEHDICTQAKTLESLFFELERILVSQIAIDEELGKTPFAGIDPAPERYWEAFKDSQIKIERPLVGLKVNPFWRPRILPSIRIAHRAA